MRKTPRCAGSCRSIWTQVRSSGTQRPILVLWGGSQAPQICPLSSPCSPNLLWRIARWWLQPAGLLPLLLRFVLFFLLKPDCADKHPCWAGWAGCPGHVLLPVKEGCDSQSCGCWPPCNPGLLCGDVICNSSWLPNLSYSVGQGCHLQFWLCSFLPVLCGGLRSCRLHLARGCETPPALPTPAQNFPPYLSTKGGENGQQISHFLEWHKC